MAKDLFFIPLGGGGGGGDMSNYYTKQQIDAMLQGVQSIQGFQGTKGSDGINGAQGIQGIKGSDGINGSQGIQGIKGADGVNGVDGSQGIQGATGASIQGLQGEQGIQGASGGSGVETVELTELTSEELGELYEIVVNEDPISIADYLAEHRLVAYGMPVTSWGNTTYSISTYEELVEDEEGNAGAAFYTDTRIEKVAEIPDAVSTYWYCIFKQEDGGNYTYVLENGSNYYENRGGGGTRYDISTKSQAELAEFYQDWERVMASNNVYVGVYPVTSVIPEYTVQGYTALLLEYNTSFALEADATTQTPVVKGDVGAYYILPNGMGGTYGTDVTMPSKGYVDAVVAGIQAIQGIQGTAGTNGVNGLQGIQGIQGASGGASKIELTTLPMQDLLQFYQDTLAGTMKDFSQYTAGGYPLINAYKMNAGWDVELPSALGGGTYTTDGTEVAIVMNQKVEAVGTRGNETQRNFYTYITLFSPTIYQTYGQTINMDIKIGYDQVAQLQFVLADDSIVNYTMPLTQL